MPAIKEPFKVKYVLSGSSKYHSLLEAESKGTHFQESLRRYMSIGYVLKNHLHLSEIECGKSDVFLKGDLKLAGFSKTRGHDPSVPSNQLALYKELTEYTTDKRARVLEQYILLGVAFIDGSLELTHKIEKTDQPFINEQVSPALSTSNSTSYEGSIDSTPTTELENKDNTREKVSATGLLRLF